MPLNRIGAPRSMKMGTTASPWRYDNVAAETIRPDNQRWTTILRYASWAAVVPISPVVQLSFDSAALSISRGIDVMAQNWSFAIRSVSTADRTRAYARLLWL